MSCPECNDDGVLVRGVDFLPCPACHGDEHARVVDPTPTPIYLNAEQNEILGTFLDLLRAPTGDGAVKRARGDKVIWTHDPGHRDAMFRHLARWIDGETVDATSGAHPLAHVAWRALALAHQQIHEAED